MEYHLKKEKEKQKRGENKMEQRPVIEEKKRSTNTVLEWMSLENDNKSLSDYTNKSEHHKSCSCLKKLLLSLSCYEDSRC